MAMNIPKVGLSRMLKEGTKHYRGVEESIMRNIEACAELATSLKSAFGPNGMNKMVINHLEKLYVTSDASTIVKELEIQHPAAKMIVLASQMQEMEIGDGTNYVILFCGALLENAEELLRMGLTPSEICCGYESALGKALEILPTLVTGKVADMRNKAEVKKPIRTALMSKQYGYEDYLADLVVDACLTVTPKNEKNFNVDNVRICKILGSGVLQSRVVHGMVLKRGVEGDVKKVEKAKIAAFTCPFDIIQTETKGTVLINTAKELLNYSKDEETEVEATVKAMADAGVNVVACGGKFGDLYLHFLNKYKMMAVRLNSKFDLRRLCKTVGATALPNLTVPGSEEMGNCSHVFLDEIGDTAVMVFKQDSELGGIATIVIRGATDNILDDIERGLNDGINTFKALTKDNRLLAGAGAAEIELARQIESFAQVCPGLEQYSIQKFAESLESIPKILADNSGVKATEILSKLYAAHQQGGKNVGFDCESETGAVVDVTGKFIFDLYLTKFWALKLACNAAVTILQVDQIIMSKPAGGPKPRAKGPDEDDD